jgi:integrase
MRPTGHIRQRVSGSWEIRYSLGTDAGGRRKVATATFKGTRREAEQELRRLLRSLDEGDHIEPGKMKVGPWLDQWLEAVREEISPKSHERYSEIVRNFLVPAFGGHQLAKLSSSHIQAAYSNWAVRGRLDGRDGGLASATRKYIHRVFRAALSRAVEQRLVNRNPADAFRNRLPKVERQPMATLTETQSAILIRAMAGTRLYWPCLLSLATGMRRGETLALRWRDVDFERHEVRVVQSLEQTKAGIRFKPPKSGRARAIAMPTFLTTELRSHKAKQAEQFLACGIRQTSDTLVCCDVEGRPYQPRGITHSFAAAVSKANGIPRVRFHDLRHTHATQLLAAGVHPKVAQERLGHSTISTTLDLYSHVTPTMQREAAERLDAGLGHAISAASTLK